MVLKRWRGILTWKSLFLVSNFQLKMTVQMQKLYNFSMITIMWEKGTFINYKTQPCLTFFRSSSISSLSFHCAASTEDEKKRAAASEDRIELKVYGIEAAGPNIKEDLVAVLHHKLNEKVVEIISILLGRNPMCKLSAEDVLFLQSPGSLPSQTVRFKVKETKSQDPWSLFVEH